MENPQQITDEFMGELFYSENSNNKTIVVLGGSDGERSGLSLLSGPLASRGFYVLTVGYFNEKGLHVYYTFKRNIELKNGWRRFYLWWYFKRKFFWSIRFLAENNRIFYELGRVFKLRQAKP
ncbi:hypothetical protein [Paenibacillus sp. Lou8.1]|uniref:hypothetical protein n=1 Tax=Paenibacillus sp. Lou8.1 TaxID=2962041 RepID=UPI0020B8165E|nr:hypothetical protein [Paenibacillus sp. Lou8.1]